MKHIIFLTLLISNLMCIAQSDSIKIINGEVAKFPGGEYALQKYIAEHITFPEEALMNDVGGTVYLSFVIDTFGNITSLEADSIQFSTSYKKTSSKKKQKKRELFLQKLKQEGYDYGLIRAAKDVIEECPKWIPAVQDGKKVKMRYRMPIMFRIF